jgi:hypothetical protein
MMFEPLAALYNQNVGGRMHKSKVTAQYILNYAVKKNLIYRKTSVIY